jgi:hypothetical protein
MSDLDQLITAIQGKLSSEDLKDLTNKLEALSRIKTQEEYDEGARLHNQKNAPWINGPYTHLGPEILNPPYKFRPYPMALYHPDYVDARKALTEAEMLPANGSDDADRKKAITLAQQWLDKTTKKVASVEEHNLYRGQWFDSPADAYAAKQAAANEVAVQAAHLAYDDRNLGDAAKREREEADTLADEHLTDVQAVLKEKKRKPAFVTSA